MPKKIEQPVDINDISLLQELINNFSDSMPVLLNEDTEIVIAKKEKTAVKGENQNISIHSDS